jgi:Phage integrase, N-terminal SAM-like domain
MAEAWLREVLEEARRGTLPGMVRTGATFADAAAEWLRYVEHDRGRKPSTLLGYRSIVSAWLLPAFSELPIESITTAMIESWLRLLRAQRVDAFRVRRIEQQVVLTTRDVERLCSRMLLVSFIATRASRDSTRSRSDSRVQTARRPDRRTVRVQLRPRQT